MKRLFTILLAVLSLLSLTACGGSPTEETSQEPLVDIQPQEPEAPPEPTPEELAAQEVEDLLASLTLEEKVCLLYTSGRRFRSGPGSPPKRRERRRFRRRWR